MGVEVTVSDTGAAGLARRLSDLTQEITIGVHEDAMPYPDGTDVATVASAHEYGDPSRNLPQRSWLRGWVASGGEKAVADTGESQIGKVVDGAAPDTVSTVVGVAAVKGVVDRIESGAALEALSAATLANPDRDSRGIPLLDTGHLVASIKWEPGK